MSTLNRYTLFLLRETRNLMRITLSANKKQIGLVRFSTPKLNSIYPTTAYLHKIEVAESHRNARIGSHLLTQMDDYLKINNPATDLIRGVLWDDQTNGYLHDFFKKNGYHLDFEKEGIFDDGTFIIDTIPIIKEL